MGVVIRPCRPQEADALLDLWHHADATASPTDTPEQISEVIRDAAAAVLVAVDRGLLVGSVIGAWDGWRGNIYRLAVLPSYRRRGIARALVAEVERQLADRGARRIVCGGPQPTAPVTCYYTANHYSSFHRITP